MSSTSALVEDAHLALLRELGAGESPHTGRSLIDHLCGTAALLESWGSARRVVLAGLFHSVYGTQYYEIQSLPLARRDRIRAAIGEEAERLAYLFCVTERRAFFEQLCRPSPVLADRSTGRDVPVTREIVGDLVEIELANYVDFLPHASLDTSELVAFQGAVEVARASITPGAYEAAAAAARRALARRA